MALLNLFSTFTIFYFSFLICNVYSSKYVPILMWNTAKSDSPLPALSRIYKEDFKDIITDKLQNKNSVLVVFAEESLSPEDFMSYDFDGQPVFAHISSIRNKWQSNYYPHVENPIQVLKKLNSNIRELSYAKAKNLKVENGQVIIINLNDARDNENRAEMLSRHDNFMHNTYKKLISEHKDVVALYTGRHSSWLSPNEQEDHTRQRRNLLETKEEAPKPEIFRFVSKNMLMYASDRNFIYFNNSEEKPIPCENASAHVPFANDSSIKLEMHCGQFKLQFSFVLQLNRYWEMNRILIAEENVTFTTNVYAPVGFSYHCGKTLFKTAQDQTVFKLSIPGFQVEPIFEIGGNGTSSGGKGNEEEIATRTSFNSAYDCVGFTSGPIWSGIFVTFILALIMTFGLCMIMDIKTMDRFDDPKGKTISINVSE